MTDKTYLIAMHCVFLAMFIWGYRTDVHPVFMACVIALVSIISIATLIHP